MRNVKLSDRKRKSAVNPLKDGIYGTFPLAGAEGIEPSALGFGVAVECRRTNKNPPFQRLCYIFQIKSYAFDALLMIWSFKSNEKSKYKPQ